MNTKIQKLKIANYKKKIECKYSFLNISNIFHGLEDTDNSNFSKKVINSNDTKIKEFSIYDALDNVYIDETNEYKNAFEYFKEELKIFHSNESIIFNILYNKEQFRIQCSYSKFELYLNEIDDIEETIIVCNDCQTKLVALLRMEYAFEVLIYCNS
ncbi:MAG: hypothetical protein MUE53_04675 [Chitinophagales bacterium]|jgi:hypothetical protein|nr:hypothetical protein [Chitinophagales bacterium]